MGNKNIILFANDGYFTYLLSRDLIHAYHDKIQKIVFSHNTKGSLNKIISIFKKVPLNYFLYRSGIQIFGSILFRRKTVSYLASKYSIQTIKASNISDLESVDYINLNTGFCFNFDIIITRNILDKLSNGIFNIHASRLPKDKGISPVLWAFARGDKKIWSSIYKVDEGIDTGSIVDQFQINIEDNDTSFTIYKRVCTDSSKRLTRLIEIILKNKLKFIKEDIKQKSTYNTWPDYKYKTVMRNNKRRHFKIVNLFYF